MKVSEVIAMLQKCPQELPVFLAYDSFVCVHGLTPQCSILVKEGNEDWRPGVYLCAMGAGTVAWHAGSVQGLSDPKFACDNPLPGKVLA